MTLPDRKPEPKPPRKEFTARTKREAAERSQGVCEAHRVPSTYGLVKSCQNKASDFDHINPDAQGGSNDLENCAHLCVPCHRLKTKLDKAIAAKIARRRGDKGQQARRAKNGSTFWKPKNYVSPLSRESKSYKKRSIGK